MPDSCVIHWFRRDLRLDDNTALHHALLSEDPVVAVFILDDYILGKGRAGDTACVSCAPRLPTSTASSRTEARGWWFGAATPPAS